MRNFLLLHGLLLGVAFQSVGRYIPIGRHRCYSNGCTYAPSRSQVDAVLAVTNTKKTASESADMTKLIHGPRMERREELVTVVTVVNDDGAMPDYPAVDGGSVIEDVEVAMVEDGIIEERKQTERRKE